MRLKRWKTDDLERERELERAYSLWLFHVWGIGEPPKPKRKENRK